jgi:hydrogenase maturation protease
MRTRIIGLGNPILRDDGAGIRAASILKQRLEADRCEDLVDIQESEVGGFALLELMSGWDRVFLVDSIQFRGVGSGTVVRLEPHDFGTSARLKSIHEIDLPTVLELGRKIGLEMPKEVLIFGIQAEDAQTFGENLSPAVSRGTCEAVELILAELRVASSA